jgi:1,4-alpha-glucan branching enzyme
MNASTTVSRPDAATIDAIANGRHADPFAVLGMHGEGSPVVRAFVPCAARVAVVDARDGSVVADLERWHDGGFFGGEMSARTAPFPYRLRVTAGEHVIDVEDPYRFGTTLGELDRYYLGEGSHVRPYERLGAHLTELDGVAGTAFAVWAPGARRVSVVGSFNDWDGRRHVMRRHPDIGIWEIFLPGVAEGAVYKYELLDANGTLLPLKADPFAFACEPSLGTASLVARAGLATWNDAAWLAQREAAQRRDAPIAIYEVHLGSWKRADGNRYLTYRELAEQLVPYAASLGFTHIELLPISEHPFDGSWGYQPIGLYAPTSRFGSPADFAAFVDAAHAAGLGVILDWVPGHFPTDAHGLGRFDGTALYEHADPRQGFQPDWNTLIFNFGRNEVRNYLIGNALFWCEQYHIDGLRVDAVASMLYLDYSRKAGEWIPNRNGGRENLEAIQFLQRTNTIVYGEAPGTITIAEESTAWPKVSQPVELGGLGFGYKWNMGWMHDTLDYVAQDPLYRAFHQDQLTFSFMYAWSENFVLPLSHDEVVHGKRSILGRMPGDAWQRFANLRAFYGFMYAHPGKKLLFMGNEFGQEREWNHDRSLDWHLLDDPAHRGVRALVGALNRLYRERPALYEYDAESPGVEWIVSDREASVVAFARRGRDPREIVVAVANFTPIVRHALRLGVPEPGTYDEVLSTDESRFGGSDVRNGSVESQDVEAHAKAQSIEITLAPLATMFFSLRSPEPATMRAEA